MRIEAAPNGQRQDRTLALCRFSLASMAAISPPTLPSSSTRSDHLTSSPHQLAFTCPKFSTLPCPPLLDFQYLRRAVDSTVCRCHNSNHSSHGFQWEAAIRDAFHNAIKRLDSYLHLFKNGEKKSHKGSGVEKTSAVDIFGEEEEEEEWNWERWEDHFQEIDEQERIVSILESQLHLAVSREDYKDAARLKVAIAAATINDTVGKVMSYMDRAIEEERYQDAAFMRDQAGAGLVGWWAGISDNRDDPYGRIIRITGEHGRYVARSYSPWQLATTTKTAGAPLFEIFLTVNKKGEYRQQAVYLKRRELTHGSRTVSSRSSFAASSLSSLHSTEDRSGRFAAGTEGTENDENKDDDTDVMRRTSGFQDVLPDMIPVVKINVLKVMMPGKLGRDLISKVIEQIIEEEEEEEKSGFDSSEPEDKTNVESDQDNSETDSEMDAGGGIINTGGRSETAVEIVVGGLLQQLLNRLIAKNLFRVPARLEKKGHMSFCFSIGGEDKSQDLNGNLQTTLDKNDKLQNQRNIDHVMFDLAKFIARGKLSLKVLTELMNLTFSQAKNRESLTGSTTFNRIEIPLSSDLLNGLYIGLNGLCTSEVIYLKRKFGQWKEDDAIREPLNIDFYEYVEALKLTGDPYVPAGEVAFRAKVGEKNQLPHKGIIPEEFGVIARYKGQGRLAERGFRNPRWVDGELVIFNGKYIKGVPVVGFVHWAPDSHFLLFFNRLKLPE